MLLANKQTSNEEIYRFIPALIINFLQNTSLCFLVYQQQTPA